MSSLRYKGQIRGSMTAKTLNFCHQNIQLLYSREIFNHQPPSLNYRAPVSVDGGIICCRYWKSAGHVASKEPARRPETSLILPLAAWPPALWQTLAQYVVQECQHFPPMGYGLLNPLLYRSETFSVSLRCNISREGGLFSVKYLLLHCGQVSVQTQTNR